MLKRLLLYIFSVNSVHLDRKMKSKSNKQKNGNFDLKRQSWKKKKEKKEGKEKKNKNKSFWSVFQLAIHSRCRQTFHREFMMNKK